MYAANARSKLCNFCPCKNKTFMIFSTGQHVYTRPQSLLSDCGGATGTLHQELST